MRHLHSLLIFIILFFFFFFNDTATTEIYTLSLHDALPIWPGASARCWSSSRSRRVLASWGRPGGRVRTWSEGSARSEEHTSELQSRQYLVCRLLLEKKKKKIKNKYSEEITNP